MIKYINDLIKDLEKLSDVIEGINHCKDCKFWSNDIDLECDYSNNNTHKDIFFDNSSFELDSGADDDQGSYAKLMTGPMFGCIKFEVKYV